MKLIDAIKNVVRPVATSSSDFSAPCEAINESLGLQSPFYYPDELDERLKAYPIFNWTCTDQSVGLDALWLDGEPVGATYRSSRRGAYQVEWLSQDIADRVRTVIASYADDAKQVKLVDPEEDIGETFHVDFVGQTFQERGFYQGRPVRALVWYDNAYHTPVETRSADRPYFERTPYNSDLYGKVLVQDGGEQRLILITEYELPFNVTKFEVGSRIEVTQGIHKGKAGVVLERTKPNRWTESFYWLVEFDDRKPDAAEYEGRHHFYEDEMKIEGTV